MAAALGGWRVAGGKDDGPASMRESRPVVLLPPPATRHPLYSSQPFRYSRVRNWFASGTFVIRIAAPS